jgi:hypothetical protein
MQKNSRMRTAESRVTIIVGLLIMLFGAAGLADKAWFVLRSERATARVVSSTVAGWSRGTALNDVTIEFQSKDGRTRRAVINRTSNASTPSTPGIPLDIYYLRADPTRVRNDSTSANWGIYGGIATVGAILVAGAIWTGDVPAEKRKKRRR